VPIWLAANAVICREERFDPQGFQLRIGIQEVVDGWILERHMLQSGMRLLAWIVLQPRKRDEREAVMGLVIRDKDQRHRRGRLRLQGGRSGKVGHHPEHLGISLQHLLQTGGRQADVVQGRMDARTVLICR
jgi:hypothetical protein